MPKFSIITISLNSEKFIEKTILSVLNQEYSDYEYIIIDGGSIDNTVTIIKKYINRLLYISEFDNGIYDAFNKGVDLSNGEYICFLNAGDYYKKSYLKIVSEKIENYDVIASNIIVKKFNKILKPNYPNYKFGKQPFLHPSLFIKRSTFIRIGKFNTKFKSFGDFEWMLRLLKYNFSYKYIDLSEVFFDFGGISGKYNPYEYFYALHINNYKNFYILICLIRYSIFHIINRVKYYEKE